MVEFGEMRTNQNGLLVRGEKLNKSKKAKVSMVTARQRWNRNCV